MCISANVVILELVNKAKKKKKEQLSTIKFSVVFELIDM